MRFGNIPASHFSPPGRELLSGSQVRGTSGEQHQCLQGSGADDAVAALEPFPSPLSRGPVPTSAEELSTSHEHGSRDLKH